MTLAGFAPQLVRLVKLDSSLLKVDAQLETLGLLDEAGYTSKGRKVLGSLRAVAGLLDLELAALAKPLGPLLRRVPLLLAATANPPDPSLPAALRDDAGLTLTGRRVVDELARLALLLDVPLA